MILTGRARAVLASATLAAIAGVIGNRWIPAFLGMSVLIWVLIEWTVFVFRVDIATSGSQVARTLSCAVGSVRNIWTQRKYHVKTEIEIPSGLGRTFVVILDELPNHCQLVQGSNEFSSVVSTQETIGLSFQVLPTVPGRVQFVGVRLRFSDLAGLFYAERFVPSRQTFLATPPVFRSDSVFSRVKQHNTLRPPGIHRHQRPGIGSELLEIREYVPGDPPRSIAWKLSARRDTLLSRQYEHEVPVRCHLFLDVSSSTRMEIAGPPSIARFLELSAGHCGSADRQPRSCWRHNI